ncbi:MAG: alpha-amylase family glycosyl hydrolase [Myxococcota bacterium]|nr:alpha-amylase family glycosyl hydrolase [Myxococcota bacterium]
MGDFHQYGVITTLHQLNQRPLERIEADLLKFRKERPMALILPSLYSELQTPALSSIVDELCHVPYLDQIVVGLDKADESDFRHALQYFSRLPQRPQIIWNDGPRLRRLDEKLRSLNLAPREQGKGRNVWYMFGYILATGKARAVALHDCDIKTYDRQMLARLIYPVANPAFSYKFCKGYYARIASGNMNGRVCRLLVTPLIRALKQVFGQNHYLEYLDSFRYALAGEFSLQRDVIEDLRIPADWGLEMGVLSEMHRNYATNQICQVDIAESYDHKHQELSVNDRNLGLSRMSSDISKSLFRKMATQGEVFSPGKIRTIKATYYRIALDIIDSHHNDAVMNGLKYDRHTEGQCVELFAENIISAGHAFLEKSMDTPFMPSWKRVRAAFPELMDELLEAVEADAKQYGTSSVLEPSLHPEAVRLKQRVAQHIEVIYGEERTEELTERLLHEANLKDKLPTAVGRNDKWSEEDVITITYGDTVVDEDERPLQTLYRFLTQELRGVINGVHILPFCPFSSDDGFSVIDYYDVNPALGKWKDVKHIADDYRLMADLVLNHCSSQSEWFKNFLESSGKGSDYFIVPEPDFDASKVVRPRNTPLLTKVETKDGEKEVWCTFSADQVDLDFANPEVLFEFVRIIMKYLKNGVRIFRLDAVAFLWKESGTTCVHRRQTHEVVKLLRLVIENIEPTAIIITETNVPNRENLSYFGNDNEAHLIYNFSLPPLLVHTLISGNCKHLKTWMMSMPPARLGRAYLNFIASHDGIGVRPAEGLLSEKELGNFLDTMKSFGGTISHHRKPSGEDHPYEINISLWDAMKGTHKGPDKHQFDRFVCAHTIALALEGLPAFYIHSLLGTENAVELRKSTGRARSINRRQWNLGELNEALEDSSLHHRKVLDEIKRRITIRKNQPAFHPNATQYTLHFGESIFAFWRESLDRRQNIFALHNVSHEEREVSLVELNLIGTETWKDLLSDEKYDDIEGVIRLAPYGCVWISNQ